ncbi:hypothetical protein [Rhodococcoides kroppenstedtii]|uniref:hypothetical protein n=1 Tax=Rhodococcoides kroppenstedtii TaxID=293050 RepID=UPI001427BE0D|nr:hypothetical protein [Rhodococcus kroppenstedtii]
MDAAHANLNHAFSCPQCLKDAIPARGRINVAHFRHGDASPGCPDYHPGLGGSSWASKTDSRLQLRAAVEGSNWNLYLKLPDLTEKELLMTSVTELQGRQIAIQHQNNEVSLINALCLWPGAGTTTFEVAPSHQVQRVYTTGNWPPGSDRWNRVVQQLPDRGAVFGQDRGGDYLMCTGSRPLYLGTNALWVSAVSAKPPSFLQPRKLNQYNGFTAWRFIVTPRIVGAARQWLTKAGTTVTETQEPTEVLTPPTSYRSDDAHVIQFDDHLIVAPSAVADVLVAESSGVFAALRLDASDQLAKVIGGSETVRIRTKSGDVLRIERQLPEPALNLNAAWSVAIGAENYPPYSKIEIPEIKDLKVRAGNNLPLRFSAAVRHLDQFSSRVSGMNADGLNSWLRRIRTDALAVEISVGSFGIICIERARSLMEPSRDEAPEPPENLITAEGVRELTSPAYAAPQTTTPVQPAGRTPTTTRWQNAYTALQGRDQLGRRHWNQPGTDWRWRIQK